MLIETAMVAPMLIVLCIGGYEVSAMVARQSVLQSTAEQGVEILIVSSPSTEIELDQVRGVLRSTAGLADEEIVLGFRYRCGEETTVSTIAPTCSEDALSTYVAIEMTDSYTPVWTQFGFGADLDYAVNRTVQIS